MVLKSAGSQSRNSSLLLPGALGKILFLDGMTTRRHADEGVSAECSLWIPEAVLPAATGDSCSDSQDSTGLHLV